VALAALFALAPYAHAVETRAYVYCTDFGSGAISNIDFGPPRAAQTNLASVCSDAVLRYFGGRLYVVERFGCDNIRVLDGSTYGLLRQYSVGNGSNPNDICMVAPTKAYVTRYDDTELWIVDPATGFYFGSTSLAAFADRDGLPEMNRLAYWGGKVFVSCQRLDRDNGFSPTDSSLVVVIDAVTNQVIDADPVAPGTQGILLPLTNPTTEFATTPEGDLLLGCTGAYGVADGGVVRIDPRTLTANVIEVTEAQLGGDISDVAVGPGGCGSGKAFCVISDASFNTRLVSYTRGASPVVASIYPASGFVLGDVEVNDRDEVWLCDRTPSGPGVRVFDGCTGLQLTTNPIGTGLPPSDIQFDATEPVGVPPSAAAGPTAGVSLAGIAPNPASGRTAQAIRLRASEAGALEIRIVNAAGRAVRMWRVPAGPGETVLAWDGADDAGRAAPAGVYLVRASLAGRPGAVRARLVRLAPARL
jgi:hypothetical protein